MEQTLKSILDVYGIKLVSGKSCLTWWANAARSDDLITNKEFCHLNDYINLTALKDILDALVKLSDD